MLACLYDVHGNLPALDRVLDDARAQGAAGFLLGGDYAVFGGWPVETLERLRELEGATWLRGNVDRWLSDPSDVPDERVHGALADCREALGEEAAAALLGLPERAQLPGGALAVHGSPLSDVRSFARTPAPEDEELLAGARPPRLIFGHTHIQFRRDLGGTELLNPGSVGMPMDGDHRAAYALVHPDGSIEPRRVAYDYAASVQRLRDAFGDRPWVDMVAARVEQADVHAA